MASIAAPRQQPLSRALIAAFLFFISCLPAFSQVANLLRVGAARIDITPAVLNGLTNLWGTPLTDVHDSIYARALVLSDGSTTAAILTVDTVEIGDATAILNRLSHDSGIPASHLTVAATHDHTSPMVSLQNANGTHKAGPAGVAFVQHVTDGLSAALRQAQTRMQPARMAVAQGLVDININRDQRTPAGYILGRNPAGPSDKRVWTLKFATPAGTPIALLINYAVHGSVIGVTNHQLTGDLPGATSRFVEQHYGGDTVALWTSGAAGDQNPVVMSRDSNEPSLAPRTGSEDGSPAMFHVIEVLGRILGEEVVRSADATPPDEAPGHLYAAAATASCPGQTIPEGGTGAPLRNVKALEAPAVDIHLGVLMIDKVAIGTVSAEIVTTIYQDLLRRSPYADTLLITLANGRIGYVPDDASYDGWTQEAIGSPLHQGCGQATIVGGLLKMMGKDQPAR